jgi:hypothetical protein
VNGIAYRPARIASIIDTKSARLPARSNLPCDAFHLTIYMIVTSLRHIGAAQYGVFFSHECRIRPPWPAIAPGWTFPPGAATPAACTFSMRSTRREAMPGDGSQPCMPSGSWDGARCVKTSNQVPQCRYSRMMSLAASQPAQTSAR